MMLLCCQSYAARITSQEVQTSVQTFSYLDFCVMKGLSYADSYDVTMLLELFCQSYAVRATLLAMFQEEYGMIALSTD